MQRNFIVTKNTEIAGVSLVKGDKVISLGNRKWTTTRHPSAIFIGFDLNIYKEGLLEVSDREDIKNVIASKVREMWERQPFVNKDYKVKPAEPKYEPWEEPQVTYEPWMTVDDPHAPVTAPPPERMIIQYQHFSLADETATMTAQEVQEADEYWAEISRDLALGRRNYY